MKHSQRKPLWILTAGLLAMPAAALAHDGLYMGVEGGVNLMPPADAINTGTVISPPADAGRSGDVEVNNQFKDGFLVGFAAGYAFPFGLRPELALDYRINGIKSVRSAHLAPGDTYGSGNYQALAPMANLWYDIKSSSQASVWHTVHPYVGGGIGLAEVGVRETVGSYGDAIDERKPLFAYQFGLGMSFDISQHMSFSVEGRYFETLKGDFAVSAPVEVNSSAFYTQTSTLQTRFRSTTGLLRLTYSFDQSPAPAREQELQDTAITPVVTPVAAAPATPAPADSDGDGVPDAQDQCPNTPQGFKVDASGCIVKQTVVLRSVNFQFNSDQLTDAARQTLDGIAAGLAGQPSLVVEIDGYTDSVGNPDYNIKLSGRRAESVRRYLVGKGVNPRSMTARGFGAAHPVAGNDTDEGRAENRRVEFVVLGTVPADTKVKTEGSTDASKAAARK